MVNLNEKGDEEAEELQVQKVPTLPRLNDNIIYLAIEKMFFTVGREGCRRWEMDLRVDNAYTRFMVNRQNMEEKKQAFLFDSVLTESISTQCWPNLRRWITSVSLAKRKNGNPSDFTETRITFQPTMTKNRGYVNKNS